MSSKPKPKKTRYPWDKAPIWANWAAKDDSGRSHWYELKPELLNDRMRPRQWYRAAGPNPNQFTMIRGFTCAVHWTKSLEARPGKPIDELNPDVTVLPVSCMELKQILIGVYQAGWFRGASSAVTDTAPIEFGDGPQVTRLLRKLGLA